MALTVLDAVEVEWKDVASWGEPERQVVPRNKSKGIVDCSPVCFELARAATRAGHAGFSIVGLIFIK